MHSDRGTNAYFSAGKNFILNYSKKRGISFPFTATENGVAFVGLHVGTSYAGGNACAWYINGQPIGYQHDGSGCSISIATFPLGKGDVLTADRIGYLYFAYFVPYK